MWGWLKKILKGAASGGIDAAEKAADDLAEHGQKKLGSKLGGVAGIGIEMGRGGAHSAADEAKKKLGGQ